MRIGWKSLASTTEIIYPRDVHVKISIKFDLFLFNLDVSENERPSIGIMRFNDVIDLGNGILCNIILKLRY